MTPRKKEEWITGKEAAALLTERSGHEIGQNYVRFLAYKAQKIAHRARDGRTEEYLKSDVEGIKVREKQQTRKMKAVKPEAA